MLFLKHILTGKDNSTYDIAKFLGILCVLVGLILEVYSIIFGVPFNITEYGTGIGILLGSIAGSLKWKESTEPTIENK